MTMETPIDLPSDESVRAVLGALVPGHTAFTVHPLAGSYSNHTHLLEVEVDDQPVKRLVFRRYNPANGDTQGKARREFRALELLRHGPVPTPTPLLLDDEGRLMGSPGIVTADVSGEQIPAAPESLEWVRAIPQVAAMLARIHATPVADDSTSTLLDANRTSLWFLKSGQVPDWMSAHPDGTLVWNTVHAAWPHLQPVEPRLIHEDYWSGNILWEDGRISAIVDWEEAGRGDPAIDVAYCRMELYLEGMDEAADELLSIYEAEAGQPVANLGFWELAAAARPMLDLDGWLTRPFMADRFRRFIQRAIMATGWQPEPRPAERHRGDRQRGG